VVTARHLKGPTCLSSNRRRNEGLNGVSYLSGSDSRGIINASCLGSSFLNVITAL
jgi:hypothetical protein